MMEELARHGYKLSAGTLYPMLHGMEKAGYLKSETQYSDGRKRRVYTATKEGRKALRLGKIKVKELFEELFEDEPHGHHGAHSKERS
jgi:DNA-binding PadR family transcriptional regulator